MIKIVKGNILNATEDIICQQVNCQGVMGAGLAKQIRDKYPEVYTAYVKFCNGCKDGDAKNLMGEVQTVPVRDGKVIVNLFGQFNYGRGKRYTDYNALKEALIGLRHIVKYVEDTIAIPYGIGCGLAGGDWDIVYKIIEEVFQDCDVTIYKLV